MTARPLRAHAVLRTVAWDLRQIAAALAVHVDTLNDAQAAAVLAAFESAGVSLPKLTAVCADALKTAAAPCLCCSCAILGGEGHTRDCPSARIVTVDAAK